VGFFKGIIEIESREDKIKYRDQKKKLIQELEERVKKISAVKR
jgi:hypothetical protein